MSPTSTYQYKALSEDDFVRLLDLKLATSIAAEIYSELIESDRSLVPTYEALSYMSGERMSPLTLCIFLVGAS
jgi:hypothetical protein